MLGTRKLKAIKLTFTQKAIYLLLSLVAIPFRIFAMFRRPVAKKATVLEPYGMGDVVNHLPLLKGLGENGWETIVSVRPQWKELLDSAPNVEYLEFEFPWASGDGLKGFQLGKFVSGSTHESLRKLRSKAKGTIGLDPRGDVRHILLLYMAGCRRVISASDYLGTDFKVPKWAAQTVETLDDSPHWRNVHRFLHPLGIEGEYGPPAVEVPRISPKLIDVVLMPAAPYGGRLWAPARWQELARLIESRGWNVKGLCGPGQMALSKECLDQIPVTEVSSISGWKQELASCKMAIALDTGPMHLANAAGLVVIALFGPTILPRWGPSGLHSKVIHHQDEQDYHPIRMNDETLDLCKKWMDRITVREVFDTFVSMEKYLK